VTGQIEERAMLKVNTIPVSVRLLVVLVLSSLGVMLPERSARADTGVLQLKVQECWGSAWIAGAQVDVVVHRPGVGTIDTDSGETGSTGYVSFTFTGLADGDELHVTVTPEGESADSGHLYIWVGAQGNQPGTWTIGDSEDSGCTDSCYDKGCEIFLCVYE
jgi:hypothetical protein